MKCRYFFLVGIFSLLLFPVNAQNDPVIMTINGEDILKSEFEYIYNKNNTNAQIDKKSLEEYLDLFVNFKLKVAEAKSLELYKSESYKKEYESYARQLAVPYMRDSKMEESLLKEAYERSKKSVSVSHILIMVKDETDTLTAYNKIYDLYNQLKNNADFSKLALENSECQSKVNSGYLGYIKVFDTVYEFENMAYNTSEGEISKPFRTKFGYHIIKVHGSRPVYSNLRVSQLFLNNSSSDYRSKADSLYKLLKKGADFVELVKKYSQDASSVSQNGDLGYVRSGNLLGLIEEAAYSIDEVGGYTLVNSGFGAHIIKLTNRDTVASYKDVRSELLKKLSRNDREKEIAVSFINKLKTRYDVKLLDGGLDLFYKAISVEDKADLSLIYQRMSAPLYTFKGNVYPQEMFLDFFKAERTKYDYSKFANKKSREKGQDVPVTITDDEFVRKTFDDYINKLVIQEAKKTMGEQYPEYRNLLREYSDGLLLFEISNREVWNKASSDTLGLAQYYEQNKNDYKWESPRFKGKVVRCDSLALIPLINKMLALISEDSIDAVLKRTFNRNFGNHIKIENGLYAQGTNSAVDDSIYKSAKYNDALYPYYTLSGRFLSEPTSYKDVKGPLTADYQMYLEKIWIKKLKEKYPVEIRYDVLKTVKRD